MTKDEFIQLAESFQDEGLNILDGKSNDYAKEDDVMSAFKTVEVFNIKPEHALLSRMTEKLSRISNIVNGKNIKVLDESVKDSLLDLANYSFILYAYLKDKK